MDKARQNISIQRWVVAIAVILFLLKLAAYYLTQSVAVLTDALESTVNVIAGFIGLYSLHVAAKPRDIDHPYGHGKAEFLSAAVEGALVLMAGLIIIYEAIIDFIHPHPLQKLDKGIFIVAFTAIVNFAVGAVCIYKGRRNNSMALTAGGKHLQSDTYSTMGIIAGLVLIWFTHRTWIDGVVSIIFACIILYTGYHILRKSVAGIMDEADLQLLQDMIGYVNQHRRENWVDLHNLRVIKYGGLLHVDCHLSVPWYLNVLEAHIEIDALTDLIRSRFGESMEFFVHTDACRDFSCPICTKEDCNVRKHAFEERVEWTLDNVIANKRHTSPRIPVREQLPIEFPTEA
ncbi:cation diffusion facilitator family transporter [Puia dinghuensis]|uniref:Cation transporter n=1 Tax=Puia dinghuensis TaxID=1792502 RepID=A0A8J2UHU2_9BACT|nr:cation diffusion facilitator family transporter [Puia dinghuensis]GGB19535.1 cation transporter [Puia dinghuensis]